MSFIDYKLELSADLNPVLYAPPQDSKETKKYFLINSFCTTKEQTHIGLKKIFQVSISQNKKNGVRFEIGGFYWKIADRPAVDKFYREKPEGLHRNGWRFVYNVLISLRRVSNEA